MNKRLIQLEKNIKPSDKTKYLSYKNAAAALNLTVAGLQTRIKKGLIKRVKNGTRPMIESSEIERMIKIQNPFYNQL